MDQLIECIPNFSEGRDKQKLDEIVKVITDAGVDLLDVEMNPDHNRAVVTFIGAPQAVSEAAFQAARRAAELIDLTKHQGEHPRVGATDVIPLVPIRGISTEECVELARALGRRIGEQLQIPVYLYEAAATRPDRENLAQIRRGEFEGLRSEIETNAERAPDFGPCRVHPTAGATVVGARFPLIAYNVNLDTDDVAVAKEIARAIRYRDGGYRFCKAMGFMLKEENRAQVSINMTNYTQTPLHRVFETVRREAERFGVAVRESEIVGLVPEKALLDAARYFLQLNRFQESQILENHLRGQAGKKEGLDDFLNALAEPVPTPGGGSVAALHGATAASLVAMVAGLTAKKNPDPQIKDAIGVARMAARHLFDLIEADKQSFDAVMTAYRLPKNSDEEKTRRKAAIQEALKKAAQVPLEVCARIVELLPLVRLLLDKGLPSAVSDVGVANYTIRCGFMAARANVVINLGSITEADFVTEMRSSLEELQRKCEQEYAANESIFLTRL